MTESTIQNQNDPAETVADILIVDDTPANLQVLANVLKESGHKVRAVTNGVRALRAVESRLPDLILLDINMPEMDGYQVCQQLKSQPVTRTIPIIFISALNETLDKVKAFELGAADYITKPFQFEEVQARVSLQLKLLRLQRELLSNNANLEASLVREKALKVQRENLVHMMVHDMRSPLSGILGYLSLLEMFAQSWPDKHQQYLHRCQQSTDTLIKMISMILDIHKMESGDMPLNRSNINVVNIAQKAIEAMGGLTLNYLVEIQSVGDVPAFVDAELIQRVLENLLGNALKFSPQNSRIDLLIEEREGGLWAAVRDQGPGIPGELHQRIFDKFGQAEARKHSTGLGLTFCKLAVEAHGGQIGLESQPGAGSTFWFLLPV